MGGGCDQPGKANGFLEPLQLVAKALQRKNWNVSVLFPEPAQFTADSVKVNDLNKENFISYLNIAARDLNAGDELLVYIDTHGGGTWPGHAHSLCLDSGGKDSLQINDPAFTSVLQNLKLKGIKIAIIDDSCYGGASVALLGEYACVLSGQSANSEGWGDTQAGSPIAQAISRLSYSTEAEKTAKVFKGGTEYSFDELYLQSLATTYLRFPQNQPQYSAQIPHSETAELLEDSFNSGKSIDGYKYTKPPTFIGDLQSPEKRSSLNKYAKQIGIDVIRKLAPQNEVILASYLDLDNFPARLPDFSILTTKLGLQLAKVEQQSDKLAKDYLASAESTPLREQHALEMINMQAGGNWAYLQLKAKLFYIDRLSNSQPSKCENFKLF